MTTAAVITLENNQLKVSGDINFSTVMTLWQQSQALLTQCASLHFDFSHVVSCNSSALALILEWKKYAARQHKSMFLHGLPAQLMSVMSVAGVNI